MLEVRPMIRCPFCDHKNPPGATRCAACHAELTVSVDGETELAGHDAPNLDNRVLALVRDGRKIEAIKLYRDLTGAGLKEAKDAVEALERGGSLPSPRNVSSGEEGDILELLRAGQKIRAIKLYRDRTGAGLAQAKEAVESLARQSGIPAGQSGCAGAVLIALTIAFALGFLLA
jgi:large subunit ribosomal protein L7/L12